MCREVDNGVEDTVDKNLQRTKGQKNKENDGFVTRCSIVMYLVSSSPRRNHKNCMDFY